MHCYMDILATHIADYFTDNIKTEEAGFEILLHHHHQTQRAEINFFFFFYHNVVGIHGLDSIQELELYLLIVPAVLKGEVLNGVL